MNKERAVDFYTKIRPDIPKAYKDTLCPKPDSELENEVKEVKINRTKAYKDRKRKN